MKNKKIFLGFVIFCIASSVGKWAHEKHREAVFTNNRVETTGTISNITSGNKYKFTFKDDKNVNVDVVNILSGDQYQYKIGMYDSLMNLQNEFKNLSTEQINYQKNNKQLISQAVKAYMFIVANDYKLVKFCDKYHPVTKYKIKYDSFFRAKKEKAEIIFNKAYGALGAKKFESALMSNPDIIKMFEQQIENDYQSVKVMANKDGITNFTRIQYCQMFDEESAISFGINANNNDFKAMVPNF